MHMKPRRCWPLLAFTVHAHEPIPQTPLGLDVKYRNRLRRTLLGLDGNLHSNPPFLETDLMGGGGGG